MNGTRIGRGGVTLLLGVTALLGIASTILAWTVRRGESPTERLADAVGKHRVARARLTGGFAYVPCTAAAPNDSLVSGLLCERRNPAQWAEAGELTSLGRDIRGSASRDATDGARRQFVGSWHVIWGNPDAAITEFRSIARLEPASARVQSDLAAAFLARAGRAQDPASILDALTAADSAVSLDPTLPEARFNRALAVEWLQLRNDAVAAWSSYLELDQRSPWAAEARERQRALRAAPESWSSAQRTLRAAVAAGNDSIARAIARQFPARVREETRRLTLGWAQAYRDGQRRPDTLLSRASTLATALAVATADSLWFDAVQSIVRSIEAGERARLDGTARGLVAYATGEAYLEKFSPDSAAPWLVEAAGTLATEQNAVHYIATLGVARVAWLKRAFGRALATIQRVRQTAPPRYRSLRAFAVRSEAILEGLEGNFQPANAKYLTAIREAADLGDVSLELRAHANLAGNLEILGLDRDARSHLYRALRLSAGYADASTEGGVPTFYMASRLSWKRAPLAASLFQQEATRLASLTLSSRRDSLEMISALARQAELFGRAGRSDEALESLKRSRAYVARIEPDSIKAFYAAELDIVEGLVLLGAHPDSALRVVRRVIDDYRHPRYRLELDRALLLFANAYAAAGAMDSAQSAFEGAIAETERRRSKIADPDQRARFLDQARPVIDRVVRFLVDRPDTLGALEFLERMRGRVLLERAAEWRPNADADGRSVPNLQSRLPANTSVVSYAVLDNELVIWVIRRDGVSMYRRPGAAQLQELVNQFGTLVTQRSPGPDLPRVAGELYGLLVRPWEGEVEAGSRVIFVPDKWLHFVPFAALFDTAGRKFVVEKFETGIAPSVQLYTEALFRYSQLREQRSPTVLAVGNPAFDTRATSLPRLPGAEAEAKRVADLYSGAHLMVGDQATKRALLRDAAVSNVVHFAGHGVVRPDAPLLSHLVLASDSSSDRSGTLTARELFETRLTRTRLAILSGCHTAGGNLSSTEGVSSLARALFAAGVPSVIASLWAVDDENTADFFASYHARLSRGEDPTTALRHTQLQWLTKDSGGWQGLSTWAAFALFGATTTEATDREGMASAVPRSSPR